MVKGWLRVGVCVRPRGVNVGVLECEMRLLFFSACPNGEVSIQSPKSSASAPILVPVLSWHTASTHMSVVCEEAPLTHTMRMFATRIALLELVLSDKKQQDALLAMTICLAITVPLRGAAACSSSAAEPRKVVGARSALLISASQNAWRAARADRGCFCTRQKNPASAALSIVLD